MTSTEVLDPFANVQVGRAVADYPGWDNREHGIWTSRGYTWCAASGPETHFACSRPQGHPASWNHMACTEGGHGGRGTVHEVWGAVALEPDPHAAVTVGTLAADYPLWSDLHFADYSRWCGVRSTEGRHYSCSRERGHPQHWQHIAANSTDVVAVWGGTPVTPAFVDPFAYIRGNESLRDCPGFDGEYGIRVSEIPGGWCRETKEGESAGWFCTRRAGHLGQHVSTAGTRVVWVKPNERDNMPAVPQPEPDPEDGSPIDDESIVYTECPEIGDVVRLRDRENRLYVMAKRNDSAEVEVLDLKRKELRAIPIDRCVKQDVPLSVAELQWVAQWYSGHRDAVRKIAVREYRKDRWCMDGLNQNLRTLGLPKYEPSLRGNIRVTLPFECTDIHAGQDAIESKVNAALRNPEVAAALRLALPLVDGIELQSDELAVRATDFSRK